MRALVAALFAFVSFPVLADGSCRSVDADLAKFEVSGGSVHEFLSGAEKDRAVAVFNALPPQSDETFEIVFVGRFPDGVGVLAFGNNGEICYRIPLSPDAFEVVLGMIKGQGI